MNPQEINSHSNREIGNMRKIVAVAALGLTGLGGLGANALISSHNEGHAALERPSEAPLTNPSLAPTSSGLNMDPETSTSTAPTVLNTPAEVSTTSSDSFTSTTTESAPQPQGIITAEIKKFMNSTTARLAYSGCSAQVISSGDEPAGILTAAHCGLLDNGPGNNDLSYYSHRIKGSNGLSYLVIPNNGVQQGPDIQDLHKVGEISQLYLPPIGSSNTDQAIGIFKGQDPQKVIDNFAHNQLSESELAALPIGKTIFMAGYPDKKSTPTATQLEYFATKFIGIAKNSIATAAQKNLDKIVLTAMPANPDGSVCSFGASGSGGFIMDGTVARTVGDLAYFQSVNESNRKSFESQYGENLEGISAICGFSPIVPTPENGGVLVNVVTDAAAIPGYRSPEQEMAYDRNSFENPSNNLTRLNGANVILPSTTGGEDIEITQPLIWYNSTSDSVTFGYYTANDPDNLKMAIYTNISNGSLPFKIYSTSPNGAVSMQAITGQITKETAPSDGSTYGDFKDGQGVVFGAQHVKLQPQNGDMYMMTEDVNGNLTVYRRPAM